METLRCIMAAVTASSVAIVVGAVTWKMERAALLPERESPSSWSLALALLFAAGAVVGSLLAGPAIARFGHRIGMASYDAILLAGLIASSMAVRTFPEFGWEEWNAAAVLFLGIGSGGLCAVIPAYVGEVSHRKIRGRLGLLLPAIAAVGVVISSALEKISDGQPSSNLTFNACCCSIVVLHLIGLCFIQKSQYFISNTSFEPDQFVASLIDELERENLHTVFKTNYNNAFRETSWHIQNAFAWRADCKALLIGVASMFFHQMCGLSTINSYLVDVMNQSDFNVDPKTVSIALGTVQVIMTGVAMVVIDQKGRRLLLLSSAVTMSLCLGGLALCIFVKMQQNVVDVLSTILATVFILSYYLGFGPVPWVIVAEIFSTEIKPYGVSLSSVVNWLMVFIRVYFPYPMFKLFDTEYIFLVHVVVCLFAALFAWKIVPETKKITLTQVQWKLDASLEVVSYIPV